MPNADARAAFKLAQSHSAKLNDLHSQESGLVEMLHNTRPAEAPNLEAELKRVRQEWGVTFKAYNAAMKRYAEAVERSRKG